MSKLLVALLMLIPALAVGAEVAPRYRLEPGMVLKYESQGSMKFEGGSHRDGSTTELLIVGKNDDGSVKVLGIQKSWYASGDEPKGEERTQVAVAKVTPDGSVRVDNEYSSAVFESVFPALPADASVAQAGWTHKGAYDSRTQYSPLKSESGDDFAFKGVTSGPEDAIYLLTRETTTHFDRAKGLVTRSVAQYSQGYGFVGKGTGTNVLKSQETRDAEFVAQLQRDVTAYEAANEQYTNLSRLGEKDEKKLDEAVEALHAAASRVQTPALKAALDQRIAQHNQYVQSSKEDARRKAELIGKPAADFTLEDVEGNTVALAELKGKVVVLDFWYRGCGWCIRAMPQIKQLADDFKDRPVVVLGMNTDANLDDAKFVIEKMALNYRTLRTTHEFSNSCGVRGFPTLILIDPAGNVADFHVGYSKDLRETVGRQISELLERPANSAPK